MTEAPELQTDRLRLLPLTEADADSLHEHWTHPDVRRYLWDDEIIPRERTLEQIALSVSNFAASGWGFWGVRVGPSDALVGFCGLRAEPETGDVELIYSLDSAFWGSGFATEGAQAVLGFAFDACGVDLVIAGADPPNDASFRLMQRLDMTFHERTEHGGLEAVYYAISRERWVARATEWGVVS